MRIETLLVLVVMANLADACRSPARSVPSHSGTPDFKRALYDSAAAARPDSFEVCTGGGDVSFVVEVLDSVTGKPAAWGAQLIWRVGRLVDGSGALPNKWPSRAEPIRRISGAYGRPGRFDILVTKTGYRDWYRAGVVVEGTTEPRGVFRCTIKRPVHLQVLLQPLPRH